MPLETTTTFERKTPLKLAALTAVVLLAHGGLLYGTPITLTAQGYPIDAAFTTRMIAAAPATQPQPKEALPPSAPMARIEPLNTAPPATQGISASPNIASTAPHDGFTQDTANAAIAAPDSSPAAPTDSAYGLMSQLLAASGPPANLKSDSETTLFAAADETKPGGSGSSSAGGTTAKTASAAALAFVFPPSTHLKYKINGEVKGFAYYVNGDLQWKQDGKTYEARMEVSHFLLGSRVQTSRGELGNNGLEPIRFGDKVRSERAAHFERSKGKVSFSANSPDAPLVAGIQDQLSTLLQLGAMLGGSPSSFPEGTLVPFDSVGPTSVESWVFKVGVQEKLTLPGGQVFAIKLVREAVGNYGTRGEVWLAPSMGYLPVRIRLIEPNGNFVDQKWSDTLAP